MGKQVVSRQHGAVMFIDMAAAPGASDNHGTPAKKMQAVADPQTLQMMPWALWGANNLLPQEMTRDIETCGILNTIINAGARFGLGEGLCPVIIKSEGGKKTIEKHVDDQEINEFLQNNNADEQNFGWMQDLLGMGNGMARFMLNGERTKIVQIKRDDITECRFSKKVNGRIEKVYHSAEWPLLGTPNDNRIFSIPLLDPTNAYNDLVEKAKQGVAEHNFSFRYPGWGKHYYSVPLWYAQYKWVKIAQGVPEMKAVLFENIMRLKHLVTIYEEYWDNAYEDWADIDDDEKQIRKNELYDEVSNYLVGAKNAHKTLFIDGKFTLDGKAQKYIEVESIEDNTKQGEYLPDSAAANSEIAFAMLFNLAIVGGNQASGLYESSQGGSNVRESILMQIIIRELERMYIRKIYKIVSRFNGWDEKYPGLEFIIPATILTTLDTGAGSKPVNTGGYDNKPKDNGSDQNSK